MQKTKPLVLIVDDNSTNIDLLVNTLKDEYRLGIAKNGPKAIEYAEKHLPDLILLDIMMPGMNGYDVCVRLKSSMQTEKIPVIFITALTETGHKTRGFEVGSVDYITKPFHAAEVKARVRTHLSLKQMQEELNAQNLVLERKVEKKTKEIREMLDSTIRTMALTVEIRDPYTAGHQKRVGQLVGVMARKMGLSKSQISTIETAGNLHDIGKIRIPTSILTRPGKLLSIEHEMLKIHPQVGYDILKNIPSTLPFARVVLEHHEKLDGSGYPQGLSGDEILMESKILSVADVVEAASSYRPYRPALGLDAALDVLMRHKGKWYDPDAVDLCCEILRGGDFKFE